MPREHLHHLTRDVHRLLDAGAAAAVDDAGLRRRLQALKPLAAQVPALAAVVEGVERATSAPANRAAAALGDLLVLVRQVRAGLARSGLEGQLTPLEPSGPWQTAASQRHVEAWAAAHYLPWANDAAELKTAVARDDFPDLRLVDPLLDKFAKANASSQDDFLADQALPRFGPALAPDLVRGLDLKGSVSHARRLRALGHIDPAGATVLARQAVATGSTTLRVEALRHLARQDPARAENIAVEWFQTKSHADLLVVAAAALEGTTHDFALDALVQALNHKNYQVAAAVRRALGRCPHPGATSRLLAAVDATLAQLEALGPAPGKKKVAVATSKARTPADKSAQDRASLTALVNQLLDILGQRRDPGAVPRMVELLAHPKADFREAAAGALEKIGDRKGLEAAAALLAEKGGGQPAVRAAWRLPARARYDLLAPLCEELLAHRRIKEGLGRFVLTLFEEEFTGTPERDEETPPGPQPAPATRVPRTDWDSRWAPLLRKLLTGPYRPEAGLALAVVLSQKAVPDLLAVLGPSVKENECAIPEALGYLRAKKAIAPLIALMPGQPSHHYCIHDALRRINDPAALAPLRELLAGTKQSHRCAALTRLIDDLEKSTAAALTQSQ